MLDATALVGVAGTPIPMVFEATEAASAKDPSVLPELGRDGKPSPMCAEATGTSEDDSTVGVERCIVISMIVHREAIRDCCL